MGYFVWYACVSFTMKTLAAPALGLHWSDITVMSYEVMLRLHYGYIMIMLWLLLRLLHQPGERLFYGRNASQERRNVSAVPMALRAFFQPLSSRAKRLNPGFSEQCEQQDSWHQDLVTSGLISHSENR